ncbi:hypothetical protein KBD87_00155 [Candidatus Saccharibacteria bacterium]|jgi:hypothetical protein|nr:hypothetical protein [Candidatus Saccharibacteria bacterium]
MYDQDPTSIKPTHPVATRLDHTTDPNLPSLSIEREKPEDMVAVSEDTFQRIGTALEDFQSYCKKNNVVCATDQDYQAGLAEYLEANELPVGDGVQAVRVISSEDETSKTMFINLSLEDYGTLVREEDIMVTEGTEVGADSAPEGSSDIDPSSDVAEDQPGTHDDHAGETESRDSDLMKYLNEKLEHARTALLGLHSKINTTINVLQDVSTAISYGAELINKLEAFIENRTQYSATENADGFSLAESAETIAQYLENNMDALVGEISDQPAVQNSRTELAEVIAYLRTSKRIIAENYDEEGVGVAFLKTKHDELGSSQWGTETTTMEVAHYVTSLRSNYDARLAVIRNMNHQIQRIKELVNPTNR